MSTSSTSALLQGAGLPRFEQVTPDLVRSEIPTLLQQLETEFSALEQRLSTSLKSDTPITWDSVMKPMQAIGEQLRWSWGVVSHLNGCAPQPREAHASQQPDVVRLSNRLGQSQVHQALYRLRDQAGEPLSMPSASGV